MLPESSITDEGLGKLREVKNLEHLVLVDTKVSEAGIKRLIAGCKIS
jgi:hypothetical protein